MLTQHKLIINFAQVRKKPADCMVEDIEGLGSCQDGGGWASLKMDPLLQTPCIESLITKDPVAMTNPLSMQTIQCLLYTLWRADLSCMNSSVHSKLLGLLKNLVGAWLKHVCIFWIEALFVTCDVDSHHTLLLVLHTQPQNVLAELGQTPVRTNTSTRASFSQTL